MNNDIPADPAQRQVFVSIGNRFVVFGPESGMPQQVHFSPEDSPILPRVAEEDTSLETRITETLQIAGMTREMSGDARGTSADIELLDSGGNRLLIDVKVREADPKRRDLEVGTEVLRSAKAEGKNLEIWFFNTERLKLIVMRFDQSRLVFDYLVPLNVWEKTPESVFERQDVVVEVDDWSNRVARFYQDVQQWLADRAELHFEQTRTVTMSEELMQKFAVADRELRVLDVIRDGQVIASFVPRGLWLIAAWGRIDLITKDTTVVIVAIKQANQYEWKYAVPGNRRQLEAFDEHALLRLMSGR